MALVNARHGILETIEDGDLISRSVSIYGEWAQHELELIQRFLTRGAYVVEAGAYIGTHALAFARQVGPEGSVLCIEPNPVAVRCLTTCKERNRLDNMTIWPGALGSYETLLCNIEQCQDPHNLAASRRSANTDASSVMFDNIPVKSLDSFDLPKCDLVKLDVEGDESAILKGLTRTAIRHRPVIFCECSTLSSSLPVLSWTGRFEYQAYATIFDALNGENFFGCSEDIFDGNREISLILVPQENESRFAEALGLPDVVRIDCPDDLALLLLKKPRYISEANRLWAGRKGEFNRTEGNVCPVSWHHYRTKLLTSYQEPYRGLERRIPACLIVPFYKQPHLVRSLFRSIMAIRDELKLAKTRVLFINDSPRDEALRAELALCIEEKADLDLTVWTNQKNLGFIGAVNRALNENINRREDAILLNSDTYIFPGAIKEIRDVAYSDPLIGFVSPRSNNATICSLPQSSANESLTPEEGYRRFREVFGSLPRFSYVPTAVGFCLHIKWTLLAEFGVLDPIFGRGYNEENDLIMRANRCGYRAVIANWGFVWHEGESSFSQATEGRDALEKRNARILSDRFPEYGYLVGEYVASPEYQAEGLLEGLCTTRDGEKTIAFDFSSFGTYHNGTFEAGKRLLSAATTTWPREIM